MEYLVNKTSSEKLDDIIKAYWKKEFDLVLYWHYWTCTEEWKQEAKEGI